MRQEPEMLRRKPAPLYCSVQKSVAEIGISLSKQIVMLHKVIIQVQLKEDQERCFSCPFREKGAG